MNESIILNDLSVESKGNEFVINVTTEDTLLKEKNQCLIAIGKDAPLSHAEEVFKKLARQMFLAQHGAIELAPEDKLPNQDKQ